MWVSFDHSQLAESSSQVCEIQIEATAGELSQIEKQSRFLLVYFAFCVAVRRRLLSKMGGNSIPQFNKQRCHNPIMSSILRSGLIFKLYFYRSYLFRGTVGLKVAKYRVIPTKCQKYRFSAVKTNFLGLKGSRSYSYSP